jgi:hypothetical protein
LYLIYRQTVLPDKNKLLIKKVWKRERINGRFLQSEKVQPSGSQDAVKADDKAVSLFSVLSGSKKFELNM